MTIYLFIDLPFNEIGSYSTSLKDGEKKRRKNKGGGEGKAGLLLRGQSISLFLYRLLSAWIHSHSILYIYHHISSSFLHTHSSDLII